MCKLKELYKAKRYTQVSFAKELGISRQYLWFIESGKYKPSLKIILRIAEKLNMNINKTIKIFEGV